MIVAPVCLTSQTSDTNNQSKGEVYGNNFFQNTFYTWTTEEQITELRKNKTLLTKSKSETKGYSLFDISLRDSPFKNNSIAKLLLEEQFAKKRFAWTNSWATVMGWEGENYGNHLIKIILDDKAIIGKFDVFNMKEPFSFFDLKGNPLTIDYVLKNKDRIAAIYHVNQYEGKRFVHWRKRRGTYGTPTKGKKNVEAKIPFREFVIVNEKMIKSWSYGTSDIKNEISSEIALLKQFQKSNEANKKAYGRWQDSWDDSSSGNENGFLNYHASTCFENNYYLFNTKNLQVIINNLQLALTQQSAEISK